MISVAIVGAAGRMGQIMVHGLPAAPDIEIVALIDSHEPAERSVAPWFASLDDFDGSLDVVVDFSSLDASRATLDWCLDHAVAAVIGTSGFSEGELREIAGKVDTLSARVLIAANFSIGAVLSERFAAMAAPYFEQVEIIELHHDRKVDAPSGTSLATARAIAHARQLAALPDQVDRTERETLAHARGAEASAGVRIHSVRLAGLVAHQEIIFGRAGEGLTIRHDSYDRSSFVAGVTLAVRGVLSRPGLTLGIDELV
jgi:4-hydroxy-tetrahydrodipicolinate reductase